MYDYEELILARDEHNDFFGVPENEIVEEHYNPFLPCGQGIAEKKYDTLTAVEKSCFRFFRDSMHDTATIINAGIARFKNCLDVDRIVFLAFLADGNITLHQLKNAVKTA